MDKTNTPRFEEGDSLVYIVVARPGGVDGLDPTNRGGPVWAFLTKAEAEKKVGLDTRYAIRPKVVNGHDIRVGLKNKLKPEERLYLFARGVNLDKVR